MESGERLFSPSHFKSDAGHRLTLRVTMASIRSFIIELKPAAASNVECAPREKVNFVGELNAACIQTSYLPIRAES